MKRAILTFGIIVAAGLLFWSSDYLLNAARMKVLPKNFSTVRAGVLYRSGQMRSEHIERVVREHGIKTFVCLNPRDLAAERTVCRSLGVEYHQFEMPGSGLGEPAGFHAFLDLVGDPAKRPVLVHCAAGAYRTGVAVASYRVLYEGWTLEDAMAEMRYSGCLIDIDPPLQRHVRKVVESIPQSLLNRVSAKNPTASPTPLRGPSFPR